MRYSLRTLLIVLAVGPMVLTGAGSDGHEEESQESPVFQGTRDLTQGHGYKCADMVRVVNALRKLGKERALDELKQHVQRKRSAGGEGTTVFFICRCLFENPEGWDPPRLFKPEPTITDSAAKKLPHFPLMFSEGVPFLVIEGYSGSGRVESPVEFLKQCESLPLRKSELPAKGFEAAARSLVASEAFGQLYEDEATRRNMAKMIMRQASEAGDDD